MLYAIAMGQIIRAFRELMPPPLEVKLYACPMLFTYLLWHALIMESFGIGLDSNKMVCPFPIINKYYCKVKVCFSVFGSS